MTKQEFINEVRKVFVGKDFNAQCDTSTVFQYMVEQIREIAKQRNALQFSFDLNRNSGSIYYVTIVNGVPEKIFILSADVSTKKVGEHYERFYGKIIDRIIANVEIRFLDTEHENIEFIISEIFNKVSEMQNEGNKEFEVMLDLYKEIKVYCDKHNLNVEQALNFLRGNKHRLEKESVK